MTPAELLKPKEAAAYLRVSPQWLSKMAKLRRGPPVVRMGGVVRYRRASLERYVAECEESPCHSINAAGSGGSNSTTKGNGTISPQVRRIVDEQNKKRVRSALRSRNKRVPQGNGGGFDCAS